MLDRLLRLPAHPKASFFLRGPRQAGKSTLLRAIYPEARRVDLLSAREFIRYSRDPGLLREEVESARPRFVVIDEVQKVPALLDEVHWLIAAPFSPPIAGGRSAASSRRRSSTSPMSAS